MGHRRPRDRGHRDCRVVLVARERARAHDTRAAPRGWRRGVQPVGLPADCNGRLPDPREIRLDGDFFIRVPPGPTPLIVRSRLLVLTVSGGSAFRITAYAREAGEQVEVLEGHIVALKSYPSNYMEPDQLDAGDMSMINRDIDLMEKEHADLEKLRAWSEALVASAGHRAPR